MFAEAAKTSGFLFFYAALFRRNMTPSVAVSIASDSEIEDCQARLFPFQVFDLFLNAPTVAVLFDKERRLDCKSLLCSYVVF